MSTRYDCRNASERTAGIDAAVAAARGGELIVLPTDTVYGIGADALIPASVTTMLAAKGRGRNMPPPVLIGTARAAAALVDDLGPFGQALIDEFWPGALTLVFRASPTLAWDLGDTKGTVALRMPLHPVALEVLRQTGPLAVSSANRHGQPSAVVADGWPVRFALDTASGPVCLSTSSATACSGIRRATVPLVSPRSQSSVGLARNTRVSAPGQNSSIRACPNAPRSSTSAAAALAVPISTGGGMFLPRPLAASIVVTDAGMNASAPIP